MIGICEVRTWKYGFQLLGWRSNRVHGRKSGLTENYRTAFFLPEHLRKDKQEETRNHTNHNLGHEQTCENEGNWNRVQCPATENECQATESIL